MAQVAFCNVMGRGRAVARALFCAVRKRGASESLAVPVSRSCVALREKAAPLTAGAVMLPPRKLEPAGTTTGFVTSTRSAVCTAAPRIVTLSKG